MIRIVDPPIPADRQLWDALAGRTEAIRLLYEAMVGTGAGEGLGWMPMLSEIIRRTQAKRLFVTRTNVLEKQEVRR